MSDFQKRGRDYPIKDGARTLPGKYYHSEEIYQEEVEKIFYKFWIYACREEEIKGPGDFKVIQVAEESIIIVKDNNEEIRAHFNVCSHRGTQLCIEESGNFRSKTIQCPYHAWTYALDGSLIAAPKMVEGDGFSKADCSLPKVSVFNWAGFIFICLAEDPEPFEMPGA